MPERRSPLAYVRDFAADLLTCLRFGTRLPIGVFAFERDPYRPLAPEAVRMLPVAGVLIGAIAAAALVLAAYLGLPEPLPALLSVTSLVFVTGALHEDGLADCADGFGGGATPQTRLAIMKDSRLGTFGTLALILAIFLRVASLAIIATHGLWLAAMVLIASAATSRALALLPLWLLPPARPQGAGLAAAPYASSSWRIIAFAAMSAAIVAWLPLLAGAGIERILVAALVSTAGAGLVTAIARRAIGGQTGDVAGAAQQVAEICAYLAFAARP